jgi:ribosomal protein L24
MATRIQVRRGTTSQWNTANPTLEEGEIGYNSTLGQIKVGDGSTSWGNLDYVVNSAALDTSLGSYIPDSEKSAINGVAELDASKNILAPAGIIFEGTANDHETTLAVTDPTADRTITFPDATGTVALTSDIAELSQDAIDAALTAGTGITKTYNDGANTLTLAVDTTTIQARVADVSDTEIGYLNGVTSAIQTQLDAKAPTANASFTGTFSAPTGTITSTMIADGTIVDGDINASAAIAQSKIADLTTDLAAKLALAGGTMTGALTLSGAPSSDLHAATKAYVDAATAGLNVHAAVQAATTANVTLASALENGDTLDGVTLATGNRVLVKNQTDKIENGIYVVKASGAPDRADDYNTAGEVDAGDFIFVEAGTANGKTGYVQTNVITTVGSDNIEFTQFSGAGTYSAGNGLTLTGTTFTIDTSITQTRVADVSDTEIGYLNGVTSGIQTQLDGKVDESLFDAKGDLLVASADNTPAKLGVGTNGYILTANSSATNGIEWAAAPISLPSQSGNSGKYLTTDGTTASWGTVSSYSAPTLGSTSIASGSTVTNVAGLTINSTTIPTSATLLTSGGALGTPASATLTNATGLPISGLTSSTSTALGVGSIELGHATDTTIARASAGVVTIEGVNIVTTSSTDTLTNKTLSSAIATTALTLNATAELRLADTDSTHYVGFKSPATVSTNKIWTLPSADGTSGQVLSTNGSATLSWSTPAAGAAFSELMLIGA